MLPTNTTSTAVVDTFRIITSQPIDSESLIWSDTTLTKPDTAFFTPSILIIPYEAYTGVPDSLWPYYALQGTGWVVNDTTLDFEPSPLQYGSEFVAVIRSVWLASGTDSIFVPDTTHLVFTTVQLPNQVLAASGWDSLGNFHPRDTLVIHFSEPLDSLTTPLGRPLVSLSQSILKTTDTSIAVADSAIADTAWIDGTDAMAVHVLPKQPLALGNQFSLHSYIGDFTGDTTQNLTHGFFVKASYRINVVALPTNGLPSLDTVHFTPTVNEGYLAVYDSVHDTTTFVSDTTESGLVQNAGDTLTLSAPAKVGCARFWKWSCPAQPPIDNATTTSIQITQSANNLQDITVTALYQPAPSSPDTVSVDDPSGSGHGAIAVSANQDCSGNIVDTCKSDSIYIIQSDEDITLSAFSNDTNLVFVNWTSSDTNINGSTWPIVHTKGPVTAVGHFGPAGPPTYHYDLCAEVAEYGVVGGGLEAHIVTPTGGCSPLTLAPTLVGTSVRIDDGCWGIQSVTYDGTVVAGPFDPPLFVGTGNIYSAGPFLSEKYKPGAKVVFNIAKVQWTLHIELSMSRANELPVGSRLTTSSTDRDRLWCLISSVDEYGHPNSWNKVINWMKPIGNNTYEYDFQYDACSVVTLNANADNTKGFYFARWLTNSVVPPNTAFTNTGSNPLVITMDKNRSAGALYRSSFRLLSIAFCQSPQAGTINSVNISVDKWGAKQDNLIECGGWSSHTNAPLLLFIFNEPVADVSAWRHQSLDLTVNEESIAYTRTRGAFQTYLPITTGSGSNSVIYNNASGTGNLYFFLENIISPSSPINVWKGQDINIAVTNGIKSTSGEYLTNYFDGTSTSHPKLHMSTIQPDISWFYTRTEVHTAHCMGLTLAESRSWTPFVGMAAHDPGIDHAHSPSVLEGTDCLHMDIDCSGEGRDAGTLNGPLPTSEFNTDADCTNPNQQTLVSQVRIPRDFLVGAAATNLLTYSENYWFFGIGYNYTQTYNEYNDERGNGTPSLSSLASSVSSNYLNNGVFPGLGGTSTLGHLLDQTVPVHPGSGLFKNGWSDIPEWTGGIRDKSTWWGASGVWGQDAAFDIDAHGGSSYKGYIHIQ